MFHAVNDGGLLATVAQARASGIVQMSQVALFKRLHSAGAWLAWLDAELARALREQPRLPQALRPRAIDSTIIQGPASRGTQWRVHYSLDLVNLNCDWLELSDAHGAELLERTPMQHGDVLLADRNYLRLIGVHAAAAAAPMFCCGCAGLMRRWSTVANDPLTPCNRPKGSGSAKSRSMAGQAAGARMPSGEWPGGGDAMPAPLTAKATRRVTKCASKKGKRLDPRTLEAAHFVMWTYPVSVDGVGLR